MTTDPTTDRQTHPSEPAGVPQGPSATPAAPFGVAPLAIAPTGFGRRRSVRRRLVDAAVVSSALATLPVAATWSRIDDRPADATLVEAVTQLDAAEDETAVRASAAVLRSTSLQRAAAQAGTPVAAPAPAGTGVVAPAVSPERIDAGTVGGATAGPAAAPAAAPAEEAEPASPLVVAAEQATASEPTPIARAAGVELVVPSKATVLVGFHEAAGGGTETMESLAPLAVELNAKETTVAPDASDDQLAAVMELPTRDRGAAAASAVDVAVPEGEDIVAPVSGEVVSVDTYTLYGRYADTIVVIEPEGKPGVQVKMVHINDVTVEVGDRVTAGRTVVAGTATQFPFPSQIDRFAEEISGSAHPHVHMEVIRSG